MTISPDKARAARQAANIIEQWLVEMLTNDQTGSVRVEVTLGDLIPVKTIERKGKTIRMGKGIVTAIETVS